MTHRLPTLDDAHSPGAPASSLLCAVFALDLHAARLAIEAGAPLDAIDSRTGGTPLTIAVAAGAAYGGVPLFRHELGHAPDLAERLVGHLVGAGANVDARNERGLTPLMIAAQLGALQVVRQLAGLGANPALRAPASRDSTGTAQLGPTAKEMAIAAGHSKCAGFLADHAAMLAACSERESMLEATDFPTSYEQSAAPKTAPQRRSL